MSIGDRIKRYEAVYSPKLVPRSCAVVRVDGRSFHTFTRGCDRPFDQNIIAAMLHATKRTADDMQGFKLAYTQSDEATFLLTDFDTYETQGWFGYEFNKVVSVSASLFTAHFNDAYRSDRLATFDSRAFTVPTEDAPNVFIWRQRDWERNSVQMFARSHFSHKQLHEKNHSQIHEMLHEHGENWAHLPARLKNGTFVTLSGDEVCEKLGYEELQRLAALVDEPLCEHPGSLAAREDPARAKQEKQVPS